MQDNISLFRPQVRQPLLETSNAVPVRRLTLRGDRNYLRALRAAEMEAWENPTITQPPQGIRIARHSRCALASS